MRTASHIWRRDRVVDGVQSCQLCGLHRCPQIEGYLYFFQLDLETTVEPACNGKPYADASGLVWFEWLRREDVRRYGYARRLTTSIHGLVFLRVDQRADASWIASIGGGAFLFEDVPADQSINGLPTMALAFVQAREMGLAKLAEVWTRAMREAGHSDVVDPREQQRRATEPAAGDAA
jgi:hypothetical protein